MRLTFIAKTKKNFFTKIGFLALNQLMHLNFVILTAFISLLFLTSSTMLQN